MRYSAAASAILLCAWLTAMYPRAGSTSTPRSFEPAQQGRGKTSSRPGVGRAGKKPRIDYTKFSHRTLQHQRECSSCHRFPSANWKEVRKGKDAFADITEYPEHSSCLGCHNQQFFARERPAPRICSVCHVAVTPRYTERHPFPNPPEIFNSSKRGPDFVSEFRIQFTHSTHIELVGRNNTPNGWNESFKYQRASFTQDKPSEDVDKSCAFCHQTYQPQGKASEEYVSARPKTLPENVFWLRKGTFKTTPKHATCFTCHASEGDVKPTSNECAACHKLQQPPQPVHVDFEPKLVVAMAVTDGNILSSWRRRHSSGTFRHENEMHQDQSCTACHKVSVMNTLDAATLKVPIAACDTCHIGESADEGALNFEIEKRNAEPTFQCAKCHIAFGNAPIPESHLKALPKPRQINSK